MTNAPTIRLPEDPWPLQIEIEFTNVCNANCSACPRDAMPDYGMLQADTLERILDQYAGPPTVDRPLDLGLPRVTVAGGGEPLIHRQALSFLRRIVARGYSTTLITNASRLTPDTTEELVQIGLGGICVSFWGVAEMEYEAAMKLPFEDTLAKVKRLAAAARKHGVPLTILWVRSPEIKSTTEAIEAFWAEREIAVDTSDNEMWNRGGLLPPPPDVPIAGHLPDPKRRIWCSDLYFSDAYDWTGTCLLCCCNYFSHQQIRVGNVRDQDAAEISRRKGRLLSDRPLPEMCKECSLPRDRRGEWLAAPLLDRLSESERAELVDYPAPSEEEGR